MKTALVFKQMVVVACSVCDEEFADDRTGALTLTTDSTVQGKRLNPGDTLTCESCNERVRIPARIWG